MGLGARQSPRVSTCTPEHFPDQAWSADVAKKKTTRSKTASSTSKTAGKAKVSKAVKASKTASVTKKSTAKSASKKSVKKTTKAAPVAKTVKKATTKKTSAKLNGKKTPTNKPITKSEVKTARTVATVTKKTTKRTTRSTGKGKAATSPFKVGFSKSGNDIDREPLTEDQLRKVKSGLSKKDLKEFTTLLLLKRAELNGDVESLRADAKNAGANISYEHMADTGSDNYEQEFTLGLVESERQMLNEIDEALLRIERGYYGVCIETGDPINRARLEAKPWAKYCIEVAREKERHAAPRFRA